MSRVLNVQRRQISEKKGGVRSRDPLFFPAPRLSAIALFKAGKLGLIRSLREDPPQRNARHASDDPVAIHSPVDSALHVHTDPLARPDTEGWDVLAGGGVYECLH